MHLLHVSRASDPAMARRGAGPPLPAQDTSNSNTRRIWPAAGAQHKAAVLEGAGGLNPCCHKSQHQGAPGRCSWSHWSSGACQGTGPRDGPLGSEKSLQRMSLEHEQPSAAGGEGRARECFQPNPSLGLVSKGSTREREDKRPWRAREDLGQGHSDPKELQFPTARCCGCAAAQTQPGPPTLGSHMCQRKGSP